MLIHFLTDEPLNCQEKKVPFFHSIPSLFCYTSIAQITTQVSYPLFLATLIERSGPEKFFRVKLYKCDG